MGFGSYDETEQENQEISTDLEDAEVENKTSDHDGEVDFEIGASNDELIDRLDNMGEE